LFKLPNNSASKRLAIPCKKNMGEWKSPVGSHFESASSVLVSIFNRQPVKRLLSNQHRRNHPIVVLPWKNNWIQFPFESWIRMTAWCCAVLFANTANTTNKPKMCKIHDATQYYSINYCTTANQSRMTTTTRWLQKARRKLLDRQDLECMKDRNHKHLSSWKWKQNNYSSRILLSYAILCSVVDYNSFF
jgi:hypothetical protein